MKPRPHKPKKKLTAAKQAEVSQDAANIPPERISEIETLRRGQWMIALYLTGLLTLGIVFRHMREAWVRRREARYNLSPPPQTES